MEGQITSIICPHCGDVPLFLNKNNSHLGERWECMKCVYTYSHSWFDKFPQFEKFVTRKVKNNTLSENEENKLWR